MTKKAGMDFVTLTDHETIGGALTLLHHPDFFVGEEVSAFFPEDGSQVDVLVYGLDAEVHREAQSRRRNVYDLVDYLREAGVAHVLAHPMYGMPGDLDRGQVEKRLVLFGLWEFINDARTARQNLLAEKIAGSVGPLEGVSDFVVDPENDEEFFTRVEELVEDPAKRERMGRVAREFAEGLDWQAVLEGLFSLYAQVAGLRPNLQTNLTSDETLS